MTDSGAGVSERGRTRIFEPLYRTKGDQRGTGLGLSIAVESARRHGGELVLASTGATGTRFEPLLPRHRLPGRSSRSCRSPPRRETSWRCC